MKSSDLGKTVMTLFNHKDETPKLKQLHKKLIQQWSRPIFQKSGNYEDLEHSDQTRKITSTNKILNAGGAGMGGGSDMGGGGVNSVLTLGYRESTARQTNGRARVPFSSGFAYTKRPEDRAPDLATEQSLNKNKLKEGSVMESINKNMVRKQKPLQKNQRGGWE